MKPIHAVTCARTLTNVPVVQSMPPAFSVSVPYSPAIIWNCVVQPECLRRSANVRPRIIQPSPVPNVNHIADSPKLNANCAVPSVHCEPRRVPVNAPVVSHDDAFPPPVRKSDAPCTFRPARMPADDTRMITRIIPASVLLSALY